MRSLDMSMPAAAEDPPATEVIASSTNRARTNRIAAIAVSLVDNTRNSLGIAVDAYMLKKTGSNWRVGLMEGFSGIGSILVGAAAGYLADKIGRAALLRASAVACIARSAALLVVIVYFEPRHAVANAICYILFAAGLIEGLLFGFQLAPLDALFTDSTPAGDRTRYFARRGSAANVGLAAGPALSVAIFLASSNTWTLPDLSAVILTAVAFGVGEAALLCLLRDLPKTESSSSGSGGGDGRASGSDNLRDNLRAVAADELQPRRAVCDASVWVASLVAVQDVITGVGSGSACAAETSRVHIEHIACPRASSLMRPPPAGPLCSQCAPLRRPR